MWRRRDEKCGKEKPRSASHFPSYWPNVNNHNFLSFSFHECIWWRDFPLVHFCLRLSFVCAIFFPSLLLSLNITVLELFPSLTKIAKLSISEKRFSISFQLPGELLDIIIGRRKANLQPLAASVVRFSFHPSKYNGKRRKEENIAKKGDENLGYC